MRGHIRKPSGQWRAAGTLLRHGRVRRAAQDALETRRFIDNYFVPRLGTPKLRCLTVPRPDQFYADPRAGGGKGGRPLSPAAARRVHVVLRRALGQAKKWGWLAVNPAVDASPGRLPRSELSPPEPEGVGQLLKLADEEEPELGVYRSRMIDVARGCGLELADDG